jgi:hypothetical protein
VNNDNPEETETGAWREMSIAWLASEIFAPRLVRGPVGPRLLLWNGNDAQWVSPILKSGDTTAYWTGPSNFTADVQ